MYQEHVRSSSSSSTAILSSSFSAFRRKAEASEKQAIKGPGRAEKQAFAQRWTIEDPDNLKCPRCQSTDTKFSYYNNSNLSQHRYLCKCCRRYWTRGGTIRNVPAGATSRKSSKRPLPAVSSTYALPVNSSEPSDTMSWHQDANINEGLPLSFTALLKSQLPSGYETRVWPTFDIFGLGFGNTVWASMLQPGQDTWQMEAVNQGTDNPYCLGLPTL